jgi:hypothetical protein
VSVDIFAGLLGQPSDGSFFSDGDEPPSEEPPADHPQPPAGGGWQCSVCGVDVPKRPGRKPKDVRCQDHEPRGDEDTTTVKAARVGRPRAIASDGKKQARLDAITGDLQQGLGKLAGGIVAIAPVTAVTTASTGPQACVALVRIASDYPKFLDGLEKVAKATPWLEVAQFVFAILFAIMVDMNRVDPHGLPGRWLGVAAAADEVGWVSSAEKAKVKDNAGVGWVVPGYNPSAPPAFKRAA